ncbi:MAG: RNA 2',3'-cyclic phosphodiesterase [Candidatus Methanomethylicia archaeon]
MNLIRAFIAIDIDEKIVDSLVKFQEELASLDCDIKFVERDNIHLTLKFLGELSLNKINEICRLMNDIEFPPFTLEVKGIGVFPSLNRPRVVWAGVGEGYQNVVEIFKILDSNLRKLNFKSEAEEFTPHITIGRFRSNRNMSVFVKFIKNYENTVFGQFNVTCIRLKKSVLTPRGPIYSNLYEVKLV